MTQTILGAGGAIGSDLAKELLKYTANIRLVSRNPKKINPTDELFPADLTDPEQLENAIQGSAVVYLVTGFSYDIKIWRKTWPPLMKNAIGACKRHNAKLVFFDNVYMYDRGHISHMTEDTPVRPTSKKGEVRAQIANMLLKAAGNGEIEALIARAPDFYGPKNSVLTELAIKNLLKGKTAKWLVDVDKIHNFIYTPDAARATALLGNTPEAYNQVWHLPTTQEKYTVRQWIELHAAALDTTPKISSMSVWMMGIVGMFMPILKEFKEMTYQYDRDYFFDSAKFESTFKMAATKPEEGIKATIAKLKSE